MAIKEFDKNQLNIEAPSSQDVIGYDDQETEDEVTTDPRELYKRFEGIWNKDSTSGGGRVWESSYIIVNLRTTNIYYYNSWNKFNYNIIIA